MIGREDPIAGPERQALRHQEHAGRRAVRQKDVVGPTAEKCSDLAPDLVDAAYAGSVGFAYGVAFDHLHRGNRRVEYRARHGTNSARLEMNQIWRQ